MRLGNMLAMFLIALMRVFALCNSEDYCIKGCSCTNKILRCDCSAGGVSELHLMFYALSERPIKVYVSHCDVVHLYPWNSISVNPLHVMNIDDVKHLHIQKLTFHQVSSMHELLISNTHLESWSEDSLGGIDGIHRLHLINVSANEIPANVFRNMHGVEDLLIANSTFNIIDTNAFRGCHNISHFMFVNTTVKYLKENSFIMNRLHLLTLANLRISQWEPRAFVPTNVDNLIIRHSKIQTLHPTAIAATNIMSISFRHNIISTVHSGAFLSLRNVTEFVLTGNLFGTVKNFSLLLNSSQVQKCNAYGNRFVCRPGMCWLLDFAQLDSFINQITNSSTCVSPLSLAGKPLWSIGSLTDDADLCGDDQSSGDFAKNSGGQTDLFIHPSPSEITVTTSNSTGKNLTFFAPLLFLSVLLDFALKKLY